MTLWSDFAYCGGATSIDVSLAYYGDDFTGSTDVIETLARGGVAAELFVEAEGVSAAFGGTGIHSRQAVGVAGMSRTFSPEQMDASLPAAFAAVGKLQPRFIHYKVCSTFDSSPTVGNIGRAMEIGRRAFPAPWTPLVVAAPHLGRYCAFGNLFARTGSLSEVHRLDRHPTMQRHPVTPMDEADLRMVLAQQTDLRVTLVDLLKVEEGVEAVAAAVERAPEGIVLFDAVNANHMATIGGALLYLQGREGAPLFVAGSSGVEAALVAAWGTDRSSRSSVRPPPVDKLLVISGSRSPTTKQQIAAACREGFVDLPLDDAGFGDSVENDAALTAIADRAVAQLRAGRSTIVRPNECDWGARAGSMLGRLLGRIAEKILAAVRLERVIVAGGDSSGEIARQLRITSLTMLAPLAPGAPLCRVRSSLSSVDGLGFVFKGGQVGQDDFFVSALTPSASP